jgi:cell division GTPase FtsZ
MSLKENVLVIGEGGAGAEIVKTLIEKYSQI